MMGLVQSGCDLDPAKWLLDPLADALADRIAGMAGGAAVNGGSPAGQVLRYVRRNTHCLQVRHVLCRIISLVSSERDAAPACCLRDHGFGGVAFRPICRTCGPDIDDQSMSVLDQQMAHVTEPGGLTT